MTLVLTELSPLGIAMAADSAVTYTHTPTGRTWAVSNQAQKLQVIPYLNAGISCWGMGTTGGTPTDQWLAAFIRTHTTITTLQDFSSALATQLNTTVGSNSDGKERLGFHLAGFESLNGILLPSFFHIHDGPSTVLQSRGISVNPSQFNANHDMPPQLCQQTFARGHPYITRNGDYQLYANLFELLEKFFEQLRMSFGIIVPNSQNIADRAEYLVFQIRTISEIYRLSNLVPGIGRSISYLAIVPSGIHTQGMKWL